MDLFQILVNEDEDIQNFEISNVFWEPQIVFSVKRHNREQASDDEGLYKIKPSLFQPFIDKKPAENYALKDNFLYVFRADRYLKSNLRVTLILFRDGYSAAAKNFDDDGNIILNNLLGDRGIFIRQYIKDIEDYGYIYYWNTQFLKYDSYPSIDKLYEDLIMILNLKLQRIQFIGTSFENYYYDYVEDNRWVASPNQNIPEKIHRKIKLNLINNTFYANVEKVTTLG